MNLSEICKREGFQEVFLLPNAAYTAWTRHRNDGAFHSNTDKLAEDPRLAYAWANVCMICAWPYQPYDDPDVIAAYYPASNAAYHAMTRLLQQLNANGIRAERASTPYRTQLLQAGIGTKMDNQLWYYPPYGTYVHLEGAMLLVPEPVNYTLPTGNKAVCDHCRACEKRCYGAIRNGVYEWRNCIRSYLENDPMPDRFISELSTFMGCQNCQDDCPKNPIQRIPVPDDVRKALDPLEILKGNVTPALEIVGKNRKKMLIRQAVILCANRHLIEALPYLQNLQERDTGMLQNELTYAIKHLQNEKNMVE